MSKLVKPSKLLVAHITFDPDMPDIKSAFPAEHFLETDDTTGFCGWRNVYWRDDFVALCAKWQTKAIPSGAVEAQAQRLFKDGTHATLTKKELRALAKDMISQRTPFSVSEKHLCLIRESDHEWFVVGINMAWPVFNALMGLIRYRRTTDTPRHSSILSVMPADNGGVIYANNSELGYSAEFHPTPVAKWVDKPTGLTLVCRSGGVKLSSHDIRLALRSTRAECVEANYIVGNCELTIGLNNVVGYQSLIDDLPFDFSQWAQDGGEAAGNAQHWRTMLYDVCTALFALTGNLTREE